MSGLEVAVMVLTILFLVTSTALCQLTCSYNSSRWITYINLQWPINLQRLAISMPNHSQITLPIHASKQYLVLLLLALLSSMHGNTMFMGFSPPNDVTIHVTAISIRSCRPRGATNTINFSIVETRAEKHQELMEVGCNKCYVHFRRLGPNSISLERAWKTGFTHIPLIKNVPTPHGLMAVLSCRIGMGCMNLVTVIGYP